MLLKLSEVLKALKPITIDIKGNIEKDIYIDFINDTRQLSINKEKNHNLVYIAIKGNNFDGHNFVKPAYLKGCIAAIVSQDINNIKDNNFLLIKVKDTIDAYLKIARAYKEKNNIKVIAITGSSGKTTTKELTYSLLKAKLKVAKSEKNFNNEIGVAKTILAQKDYLDYLILEFGARKIGDIELLSSITYPEIAVITNITTAHIGIFKNKENILKTKSEIIKYSKTNIFNKDDESFLYLSKLTNKYISVSLKDKNADIYAEIVNVKDNYTTIKLYIDKKNYILDLPFIGTHFVYDFLLSIGVLYKLNLLDNNLNKQIKDINLPDSRFNIYQLSNNITLIDDCYNANHSSMKFAIQTAKQLDNQNKRRKIAILGDMLELGKYSKELHEDIARILLDNGFKLVLTYGTETQYINRYLNSKLLFNMKAIHFKQKEEVNKFIYNNIKSGDIILIKGSRAMHLEEVVNFIKSNYKRKE